MFYEVRNDERSACRRADDAHQQHRAQIDMRVEQREGGRLRHRHSQRQRRTGFSRVRAMGLPCAAQRLPDIDGQ